MLKPLPKMPPPEVYEQEYSYWPWGHLLRVVVDYVAEKAPGDGFVLDYMCGTGFMLHEIGSKRPDLALAGCTLEPNSYVDYANVNYPEADIIFQDALDYQPMRTPDVISCMAGIHHLSRNRQAPFVEKIAKELKTGGLLLVGEELIRTYTNEIERRLAVLEMCGSLVELSIRNNTPDEVVQAAIDLISNDVFENGEYKFSFNQLVMMIEPYFEIVQTKWIWPELNDSAFGDVLVICRKR